MSTTFHQHEKNLSDVFIAMRHRGMAYGTAKNQWFAIHTAWQMDRSLTEEQRRSLRAQSAQAIAEIMRFGEKTMTVEEFREECRRFDWRCDAALCPELGPLYAFNLQRLKRIAGRSPAYQAIFAEHLARVEEFYGKESTIERMPV